MPAGPVADADEMIIPRTFLGADHVPAAQELPHRKASRLPPPGYRRLAEIAHAARRWREHVADARGGSPTLSRWTSAAMTPAILATVELTVVSVLSHGLGVPPIYVDDEQARRARPVLCLGVLRVARRKPLPRSVVFSAGDA